MIHGAGLFPLEGDALLKSRPLAIKMVAGRRGRRGLMDSNEQVKLLQGL